MQLARDWLLPGFTLRKQTVHVCYAFKKGSK